MPDDSMGRDNDLVLPPNTYAYVLDETKGKVSVYVGPYKNSLSNTDRLVVWDAPNKRFVQAGGERAISTFQMASEGQYIVLSNPADENIHPPLGNSTEALPLETGRQVNVPGPVAFPLWPGQVGQTIDGHHLRHNQYLLVRVYDAEQATANAAQAVIATTGDDAPVLPESSEYTMGQLIIVEGTQVSFYIPPTGIEVVPEGGTVSAGVTYSGTFVREAVTLERLEYCILLDENGEKRYVQGPDVVFPRPTEQFVMEGGTRKFRAIELNEHSGLYIKVIAPYTEDGVAHPVGEELFITGAEQAIYFPRPEHSIITYDEKRKHHAIAIPAGEGRYVLDRDHGTVDLVRGPLMYLPDPRNKVIVLRILDPYVLELLYPGNEEAKEVNARYEELSNRVGHGEHLGRRTLRSANMGTSAERSEVALAAATTPASSSCFADEMTRGTTYTPPRSIVLDTKYEGAVTVEPWPGYAILVTNKTGDRRVEIGPKVVLLAYDETVMSLSLSRGRPKDDSDLLHTAYLRIINNQISDRITVETKDLVRVTLDISYRVNFEAEDAADREKWFSVENYVKVLTDHGRSRLRNAAKRNNIQSFYGNSIDIIRDVLLGEQEDGSRPGLYFEENGMRVYDVEVLNVRIEDPNVSALLQDAQGKALTGAIQLSLAQEEAERTTQLEELKRQTMLELDSTAAQRAELVLAEAGRIIAQKLLQLQNQLQTEQAQSLIRQEMMVRDRAVTEQEIELAREADAQRIETLVAQTNEDIKKIEAFSDPMMVTLTQLGDTQFVQKIIDSLGPAAMAAGVTTADLFKTLFGDTPFEGFFGALSERPVRRALVGNEGDRVR